MNQLMNSSGSLAQMGQANATNQFVSQWQGTQGQACNMHYCQTCYSYYNGWQQHFCPNQVVQHWHWSYPAPRLQMKEELEFLIRKLMEVSEENGKLKSEIERLKKKAV